VVSWMLLGGRCRDCGQPIHWRYPVVEALSGLLWLSAGIRFGATPRAAVAVALFYMLLVLAFIDLDTMRLPNKLVGTLGLVGLVAALGSQLTGLGLAPLTPLPSSGAIGSPLGAALLGVVVGGGFVALLTWGYGLVRGGTGFGMGDVKLIAVAGLFLGPYVLIALMLSSAFAILGATALVRGGEGPVRSRKFPFGPFLACGIVTAALAGPAMAAWYVSLLG
jgi:leader peptidase (prepilin peptidase)/N-methyltransferase